MTPHRALRPVEQFQRRPEREIQIRLLTERQAAEYCLYLERGLANPVRAFQVWARRQGVPVKYVGRFRTYDPRVLDAFMERESWTRRHKVHVPHSARLVRMRASSESEVR